MKVGDVVRNRNAHRLMNNSRGVFLGLRTFVNQNEGAWKVGGSTEEEFYVCAMVLWYGESKPRTIQTSLIYAETAK
jgi:hypothetical protein